jgi:hypothetical protein
MIDIEFEQVTEEVLEQPRPRDRADARKGERVMDLAQRFRVHVLEVDNPGFDTTGNVLHLAEEKSEGHKRIRRRVVMVGAVWLLAGIAMWIATSDGLRCRYLHDETACARLEWQSALYLAKKRIEAGL